MYSSSLHRYALLVSVWVVLVIATGASVTNVLLANSAPAGGGFSELLHSVTGAALLVLTLLLAFVLRRDGRKWLQILGWTALIGVLVDAGIGREDILQSAPRAVAIMHALIAHLLLSTMVAIAIFTSRSWNQGSEPVRDHGWPSLRSLSIITPVLVLSQVMLGAALRHRAIGITPHIISAMLVAFIVLALGVFVTQQFPDHRPLCRAAITMMTITSIQVFLGVAALTARMVGAENAPIVLLSTAAHVTTGSLTLASSVVMAVLIRRHVQAAAPEAVATP